MSVSRRVLGRSGIAVSAVAQGALAWVLARHPRAVPIPGFRTVWQVEQNAGVLSQGPLDRNQMQQIEDLLQAVKEND